MYKISPVAKNYAKALFKASTKNNTIDKISKEITIFKNNFSKDFACELKNPAISKKDSVKIITEISKKINLSGVFVDFISVVALNKRLALFDEIYQEFFNLVKKEKNILEVELISTQKLEESAISSIKQLIAKKYSNKTIEIKESLKTNILGGFQIKIGSNLIDASLKNQLALIEKELVLTIN